MTEYVAQAISKFNSKIYYVSVTGKNKNVTVERLFEQYKGFNFNIFTKAEFCRCMYEENFVFDKYNEDGSLNKYHYIGWEHLPSEIKEYYRQKAIKSVIEVSELNKIF